MREKLSLPEHEVHDEDLTFLADDHVARYGGTVLMAATKAAEAEYDVENHIADTAFLEQYTNRKWWKTAAPSKGDTKEWLQQNYSHTDSNKALHEAEGKLYVAQRKAEHGIEILQDSLDAMRHRLSKLSPRERDSASMNIERGMVEYAISSGIHPNDIAMWRWKQQAEQEEGRELSWVDWLSLPPDSDSDAKELGKRDRQMVNFLEWNQHHFNAVNNNPEVRERFRHLEQETEEAIRYAVQHEVLDPALLRNFVDKPIVVGIGEPIDEALINANGYASTGRGFIMLRPGFKDSTFVHERTHQLGGLGETFWNEGATQYIADVVDAAAGRKLYESFYEKNIITLSRVIKLAGMSKKEFSKFYAADDYEGFVDEVQQRTGFDVHAAYEKAKTEAIHAHPDDHRSAMEDIQDRMLRVTGNL